MSAQNGTTEENITLMDKGKGKAVEQPQQEVEMGEAESSEEEESGAEEHVEGDELEEADEDNMEEIDTDNIISDGRRTRGKTIDFAKAAQEAGDEDEDEDDDEDFEDAEDPDAMRD